MMRAFLPALLLMLAGCAEAHPTDFAPYTLRIQFEGGLCGGTAVGANLVLTAKHCFDNGRLVSINGQPAYALKLVKDGKDHALVRVSTRFKRWATMGAAPRVGDRLRYVGHPLGLEWMYREGVVSGEQEFATCPFNFAPTCRIVFVDVNGTQGDSGSGLFDRAGRLVGVYTGVIRANDGKWALGVMIPLEFTRADWIEVEQP